MPMHWNGRKPVLMQNFKSSTAMVIELRLKKKKKKMKKMKMKNLSKSLYFIPHLTFSFHFLDAVTFLHVLHLDVLRRQIEIETESKS